MERYYIDKQVLVNIAEAIRQKAGIQNNISPREMPTYILQLSSTGVDGTNFITNAEFIEYLGIGTEEEEK